MRTAWPLKATSAGFRVVDADLVQHALVPTDEGSRDR